MSNNDRQQSQQSIRIKHVRLVTKGLIIGSVREALDAVPARENDKAPSGYDIWYVPARRAFRFDRYEAGALFRTNWMHESRIDVYEEWDATPTAAPAPSGQSSSAA